MVVLLNKYTDFLEDIVLKHSDRNFGLDIARCVAILLVVFAHSLPFISKYSDNFRIFNICGFLGVEIFFVLSGFLIGQIIIKSVLTDSKEMYRSLKVFYVSRWLRTLPSYYLIVIILIVFNRPFVWTNLLFIQNFNVNDLTFFPVSWSLTIEEWFYLLIPLIMVILSKYIFKDTKKSFFFTCILVILGSLALRFFVVYKFNVPYDLGIRKQIYLRLDGIMFGVLFAGVKTYYNKLYTKLAKSKFMLHTGLLFFVFTVICSFNGIGQDANISLYKRTLFFTFSSISCIFIVVWLEQSKLINSISTKSKILKSITFISKISYSLYLIHHSIIMVFLHYNETIDSVTKSTGLMLVSVLISILLALIMYKYFESPIMNYRKKLISNMNNNGVESKDKLSISN